MTNAPTPAIRPKWIVDRQPTAADADEKGLVAVLVVNPDGTLDWWHHKWDAMTLKWPWMSYAGAEMATKEEINDIPQEIRWEKKSHD